MSDLLTLDQLLTLPGSVLAVSLVVQAAGYIGGERILPALRYVALAVSLILGALPVLLALPAVHWSAWLLAAFNAFVIFLAAVGVQTVATSPQTSPRTSLESADLAPRSRRGLVRWWR